MTRNDRRRSSVRACLFVMLLIACGVSKSVTIAWALVVVDDLEIAEEAGVSGPWDVTVSRSVGRTEVLVDVPSVYEHPANVPSWSVGADQRPTSETSGVVELAAGLPWRCLRYVGRADEWHSAADLDAEFAGILKGETPGTMYASGLPLLPMPGLIGNTVVSSTLIAIPFLMWAGVRRTMWNRRASRGRCPRCRYPSGESRSAVCPECGTAPTTRPAWISLWMVGTLTALTLLVVLSGAGLAGWSIRNCPYSALHIAAYQGDVDTVRSELARGAPVDSVSRNAETALMLAATRDELATMKILLDAGADINYLGPYQFTALSTACGAESWDAFGFLLDAGADPSGLSMTLFMLVRDGNVDAVRRIIAAGGLDPNSSFACSAMSDAVSLRDEPGSREIAEMLHEAGLAVTNSTATDVIEYGDMEALRWLMTLGWDTAKATADGYPLFQYVDRSPASRPMWEFLIEQGVDPDAVTPELDWSAVQLGISEGQVEFVRFLLENGASANSPGLMAASWRSIYTAFDGDGDLDAAYDILELLLEAGADTETPIAKKLPLLEYICRFPGASIADRERFARLLLEHGAEPVISEYGMTGVPQEMLDLLQEYSSQ